jgi:hypothetical protein
MYTENFIAVKDNMNNNKSWLDTEKSIKKEVEWLKKNILPYQSNVNLLRCSDETFYRLISILIVSGNIKVNEHSYKNDGGLDNIKQLSGKQHGSDWHNNMIKYLSLMFLSGGYKVFDSEPQLYYGSADLKIVKSNKVVYFEVDTINIFKLWINLLKMKNVIIIIVTHNKIIKFEL